MQAQPDPLQRLGTRAEGAPGVSGAPGGASDGASEGLPEGDFGAWLQPAFLLLGVSLLTWMMMRIYIRRRQRISITEGTPQERLAAIHTQARKRAHIDGFAADVHELVQRLASQVDVKAARIEQLLEDADERIRKLERMNRTDQAHAAREPEPVPDDEPDRVTSQVYELADRGEKPIEIARQLNQHVGQVELILALRRG